MNDLTILLGFLFCSSIVIIMLLAVIHLIRKDLAQVEITIKKLDAVYKRLLDMKYR